MTKIKCEKKVKKYKNNKIKKNIEDPNQIAEVEVEVAIKIKIKIRIDLYKIEVPNKKIILRRIKRKEKDQLPQIKNRI